MRRVTAPVPGLHDQAVLAARNAGIDWSRNAGEVVTLPPWDDRRAWLRLSEVPCFIKTLFGVNVGKGAIENWAARGVEAPTPAKPDRRLYLRSRRLPGRASVKVVKKADLIAFLEEA